MVSVYCSCQTDSLRKGIKRADFDLFDTAASSVWVKLVEKVQVSLVGWFVVGNHFGFELGTEEGGVADDHLELALLHHGGSGVELG